jgi:hypothetical protein
MDYIPLRWLSPSDAAFSRHIEFSSYKEACKVLGILTIVKGEIKRRSLGFDS